MEIRELVKRAFQRDLSDPSALSDAFDSIRLLEPEDFSLAHERNKEVRRLSAKFAAEQKNLRMFELNKRSLLFDAPYDFDAHCRYIEWSREPSKRFYLPRRKQWEDHIGLIFPYLAWRAKSRETNPGWFSFERIFARSI